MNAKKTPHPPEIYFQHNLWANLLLFDRCLDLDPDQLDYSMIMITEYMLESEDGGPRLIMRFARPTGSFLGQLMIYLLRPMFIREYRKNFRKFKEEIEKDYRAQLEL